MDKRKTISEEISNVVVEYKSELTYGEALDIDNAGLGAVSMEMTSSGEPKMSKFSAAEFISASRKKSIETIIVSVNGEKENVYDSIMNLPKEIGAKIEERVEAIKKGMSEQKKSL